MGSNEPIEDAMLGSLPESLDVFKALGTVCSSLPDLLLLTHAQVSPVIATGTHFEDSKVPKRFTSYPGTAISSKVLQ